MTQKSNNAVNVRIPTPLRAYTNQQSSIMLHGETVGAVMDDLIKRFPDLRRHLLDERGQVRSFVSLYLNGRDIVELGGPDAPVGTGDKLSIVPAIAGGVNR
jgi:molybdopterin converting factor small subunit